MIYVHIPFCRSFCTYCDFYSEVASRCRKAEEALRQETLFERYAKAVSAEALSRAKEICGDVDTLYLGGGTPSVLPLSALQQIVDSLRSIRGSQPYKEFTVEVNPEDIVEKGYAYVEGLLKMGVNRVSMGVQSFDDDVLKFMNRRHDAEMARKAYHILEESGVENISIDLIFGLPQLSDDAWQSTLDKALEISSKGSLPCHISSYQLSVEPGSALASLVERGLWSEAAEDLCERHYGMLCGALSDAGYHHYEISNFALPGYEAVHNSAYWNHTPYVGLGPGAHSFIGSSAGPVSKRQWNISDVNAYIDAAESGDFTPISESETLTEDQLSLEHIMLGLRTSRGVDAEYLRTHISSQNLERALSVGNLVETPGNFIRIPENRFFISDSIIADII